MIDYRTTSAIGFAFFVLLSPLTTLFAQLPGGIPKAQLSNVISGYMGDFENQGYDEKKWDELSKRTQLKIINSVRRYFDKNPQDGTGEISVGFHFSHDTQGVDSMKIEWMIDGIKYTAYESANLLLLKLSKEDVVKLFVQGEDISFLLNNKTYLDEEPPSFQFEVIKDDMSYFTTNDDYSFPIIPTWYFKIDGYCTEDYFYLIVYKINPQITGTQPTSGWLDKILQEPTQPDIGKPREWTKPKAYDPTEKSGK